MKIFKEEELSPFECKTIAEHTERLRYTKLNPLFSSVVREIISPKENMMWKNDIIVQAPCGSGKSCCFTVASQILGRITVRLLVIHCI